MTLVDGADTTMKAQPARKPGAPGRAGPEAEISVTFVPAAASEKLLPDWRGLADQALESNPFMAPEFIQPAAMHLAGAEALTLACVWRRHPRSQELIGVFALAGPRLRRFRWLQSRKTGLWLNAAMPLSAALLARNPAVARQAVLALLDSLSSGDYRRVCFPGVDADGPLADILAEIGSGRVGGVAAAPDLPRSRGLDIMLRSSPGPDTVAVAREPAALRAMLEQALVMDAGAPRSEGDPAPLLFDARGLAFLRAAVRGFANTGQVLMGRYSEDGRKAAAVALVGADRTFLWRLFGPAAQDPRAEAALACAFAEAAGKPVVAAAHQPMAGFCVQPLRTQAMAFDLLKA